MNELPTALFVAEDTPYGTVYHPANELAVILAAIAGTRRVSEDAIKHIRKLFCVATPSGQPLPFPRHAYARVRDAEPRHIRDEA